MRVFRNLTRLLLETNGAMLAAPFGRLGKLFPYANTMTAYLGALVGRRVGTF
jgi:hypothetical protein